MGQRFEQRRVGHGITVLVASQNGCQIETEAVDMVVNDPVAQALDNHFTHVRIVAVQRVAATAEVIVAAVGLEHVVGLVVDAAIGDGRAVLSTLGSMVEHHVEHDLNAILVQSFHQVLQLVHLHAETSRRGVGGLRCEEADVAVAPQVAKGLSVNGRHELVLKLVKLMDGHQLHTVDTQFLEIRNLLDNACKGAFVLHPRSSATGEVAHVHFIDDEVIDGRLQGQVFLPVEVVQHNACPIGIDIVLIGLLSPHVSPGNHHGIGVEQDLRLVEVVTFFRLVGAVHAETVFYVFIVQVEDNHRKHVAQAELLEKGYLDERFLFVPMKEHQRAVGSVTGIHGEVHHVAEDQGSERIGSSLSQLQTLILVRRKQIDSFHL